MAIGKTSYNGIPPKPRGNTDNKVVTIHRQIQHSHAHAEQSVDCSIYLLYGSMQSNNYSPLIRTCSTHHSMHLHSVKMSAADTLIHLYKQ